MRSLGFLIVVILGAFGVYWLTVKQTQPAPSGLFALLGKVTDEAMQQDVTTGDDWRTYWGNTLGALSRQVGNMPAEGASYAGTPVPQSP